MTKLEWALHYLKKGVSVIPVGKDKKPIINWKPYQEKLATVEEIKKWFSNEDAQIGIVTGKISKILVIDIEKGGDRSWLPDDTTIIKTGGGGWHYYYTYVPGVTNKVRIKDLVDIRGEGGFCVAPPSETTKGKYEILQERRLQPFPKYLFEGKPKPKVGEKVSTEYVGVGEGQRNDSMTKFIGLTLAKIHPADWDSEAWSIITSANYKNTPPLPETELKNTFESIKQTEKRNHRTRWYKYDEAKETKIWKDDKDDILHIEEVAKLQKINSFEKYKMNIGVFDTATEGGVNDGDLIVISAPTSMGKTSFAQTMSYHFSNQALPCLWFSYEVLMTHLWEKFKKMGVDGEWLLYTPIKNTTGNVSWIEQKVKEAKEKYFAKIVVIDHLGFLLPRAKINDISRNYSAYLGQICRDLKTIALQEEIILILLAHMRKTDNPTINDIGNSVAIAQEADLVFTLDREISEAESGNYYTDFTKIIMAKNRKTGQTVKEWFTMENELFIHDPFYKGEKINNRVRNNF